MRRGTGAWVGIALALLSAAPAAASPYVHAHRGGAVVNGVPTYGENTLEAFRKSAARGFVLEADVKLTKDRRPVVIHDATLDRTTDCTGMVRDRNLDELKRCRVDVLGSGTVTAPDLHPNQRVPTLEKLLALAAETGARLNLEIKNIPTEADFEAIPNFAHVVVDALEASDVPRRNLIVQSFWPGNLDVVEDRMPEVETSLLTLEPMNSGAAEFAKARGYEWISPGYGVALVPTIVQRAHAEGLRVVPYTPNSPALVASAVEAGVDAVITDDPEMARTAVRAAFPDRPAIPPPPSEEDCAGVRASRSLPTVEAFHDSGAGPRVFAMQFKQDSRHVVTYESFRTKIECMVREHVVPRLAAGRPNVIAFNEDIGLATIATGSRGKVARDVFARPGSPSCESDGVPCGTLAGLAAIRAAHSRELAAYRVRFPRMSPIADSFVATTDTFARGWMQVFSDVARRYGVWILGSNTQAPFRESVDPLEIATFADPDRPLPKSVFVATSPAVYNEVFMWGPEDVRQEGPWPLRNVVASNQKVPLTALEKTLEIAAGPSTGPDAIENVRPYSLPGTRARISFATSLPAFVYGPRPADGVDPCSDTARWYMRCLDRLGANLVMQDEANPGRWASAGTFWQPLEWMASTWRAVADPEVSFAYNVTPHLVGNLADLAFDGQTAITQRGGTAGAGCHYVGNMEWLAGDPAAYRHYAGPKTEFLALLPWVAPDGGRAALRETGGKLAPGSGDPLENDYVEGAVAADLPFPPDTARPGCAGS